MKTCGKCKRELPESCFAVSRAKPDGLQGRCRPCTNNGGSGNPFIDKDLVVQVRAFQSLFWWWLCDTRNPHIAFARAICATSDLVYAKADKTLIDKYKSMITPHRTTNPVGMSRWRYGDDYSSAGAEVDQWTFDVEWDND